MPLLPSSKHGLGYRPDPVDPRDAKFTRDFGVLSLQGLPPSMRGLAPVLNQGATSSCVANAVATAIMIREKVAGVFPVVQPSRLALYWNARYQHGAQHDDAGTYIRSAVSVLAKIGVPDEAKHPFSTFTLTVNKQPPVSSYIEGHQRSGGRYVRIASSGDQRIDDIRAALRNRLPVVFGTPVDKAFLGHAGGAVVARPRGQIVGGHAMCVVADDPMRSAFIVQNSWGAGWGDRGFVALSYEYLAWSLTSDIWCVDGWKRIQGVGA